MRCARGWASRWSRPTSSLADLLGLAPQILPFAEDVWERLDGLRAAGKRILFEGAQATMLDIDHGTYPFVTSSNTVAAQAMIGSGMGNGAVGYVLGIAKAYTTRVGDGPFPTELTDEIGQLLGTRGNEFGTNTGRPRRCGWFDAIMVRQAVKLNGIDGIALTKLDVLDGLEEIKVCVGYELDGKRIERFPFTMGAQAKLKPVWETFEGWGESTRGARSFAELPATCIKYVRRVEELVGCPVALLSTSPQARRHHPDDGSVPRLRSTDNFAMQMGPSTLISYPTKLTCCALALAPVYRPIRMNSVRYSGPILRLARIKAPASFLLRSGFGRRHGQQRDMRTLGPVDSHRSHRAIAARVMMARKFLAVFSYRVAPRRKCLSLLKQHSTRCLSL